MLENQAWWIRVLVAFAIAGVITAGVYFLQQFTITLSPLAVYAIGVLAFLVPMYYFGYLKIRSLEDFVRILVILVITGMIFPPYHLDLTTGQQITTASDAETELIMADFVKQINIIPTEWIGYAIYLIPLFILLLWLIFTTSPRELRRSL